MQPISFEKLTKWIFSEFEFHRTIFGIPEKNFFRKNNKKYVNFLGEKLEIPLGPAAGPHTQLAQNIITAYLCGGRFFELKTVQILDELKIQKPCISAEDEGYNAEWSTELTTERAFEEYLKAWLLIHILHKFFKLSLSEKPKIIFNMSVGYDLEGIQSSKINTFIENMKDASKSKFFSEYKSILLKKFQTQKSLEIDWKKYIENISPNISNSATLSTMHGCPSDEIENICKYLIKEKNLHTFVKLNPTLLGYKSVKNIFKKMNFHNIELTQKTFSDDLQFADAMKIIKELYVFSQKNNKQFGIKLSNTLPVINLAKNLPGNEMYMSGKSLFPITINLASKISSEFDGDIKISYSGGANFHNIKDIFEIGISPITLVTNLLKPGGYLRLKQLSEIIDSEIERKIVSKIDFQKLEKYSKSIIKNSKFHKAELKHWQDLFSQKDLPLFDCTNAPCVEICPIHQDIPEYIDAIENGEFEKALKIILEKNPLLHITGFICDHKCQLRCTRNFYEESLLIRDLKRIAAEEGFESAIKNLDFVEKKINIKVAIIGAGPSGLSAGYFLAKNGFGVTIFDKKDKPGGTVQSVIPNFRISQKAIENDIKIIKKIGVKFQFGIDKNFSIQKLKSQKFKYIYLAIGATKSREIKLENGNHKIYNAIGFLKNFKKEKNSIYLGKKVAIIGGGNSAIDSARSALRINGVEKVFIIYRRTKKYMPADFDELNVAIDEGIIFKELLSPISFSNGILKCQKMKLGKFAEDGRRISAPMQSEYETFEIDTIISAIGEMVDEKILSENKIKINANKFETNTKNVFVGGDALRGPSTVVRAIADGKKVAEIILNKEKIYQTKNTFSCSQNEENIIPNHSDIKPKVDNLNSMKNAEKEAKRCLKCNLICNRCVDVCPNRANIAIKINHEYSPTDINFDFNDLFQILHIYEMCNECGNCETFCPYEGAPYKEKFTLFWNENNFRKSKNNGFYLKSETDCIEFEVKFSSRILNVKYDKTGKILSDYSEQKIIENKKIQNIFQIIWSTYENYKFLFAT